MVVGELKSKIHPIRDARLQAAHVSLFLKRDDLVQDGVPGNKVRKLKHNLDAVLAGEHSCLLTFGGAYSNLLRAVAALGRRRGIATVGIVRGEKHDPPNASLQFCLDHGMTLEYVSREQYRRKADPEFLARLATRYGNFYVLPEGGSNELAVRGCAELVDELMQQLPQGFDYITCSVGTGGTMAGIIAGLAGRHPDTAETQVLGFSALKGGSFLAADVGGLLVAAGCTGLSNWQIETDYHFGGYAKRTLELDSFIEWFDAAHGIGLDWVYEAKMLFGLYDLIDRGRFARGSRIVAVLAGGPELT